MLNQYTLANTLLAILGFAWPDIHSHILETLDGPGAISEIYPYCFSKCGMMRNGTQVEMRVKLIKADFIVYNFPANVMTL